MRSAWRLAWRNLRRNRRRNVLTGAAVAFACAALILTLAFVAGIETYLRVTSIYLGHNGHLLVYKRDGLDRYVSHPARYALGAREQRIVLDEAARDHEVAFAAPFLRVVGLVGDGCKSLPFVGVGVEPEVERRIRTAPEVRAVAGALLAQRVGRPIWDVPGLATAVEMSRGLARRLGKNAVVELGRPAVASPMVDCAARDAAAALAADPNVQIAADRYGGGFSAVDGDIVAIIPTGFQETEPTFLLGVLATWQGLLDTDAVTDVGLFLKDAAGRGAQAKAEALQATLRGRGADVSVYTWKDERVSSLYVGTMRFLRVMLGFVGAVVILLALLSVVNAATMTVVERTREIGMLRAMGFLPSTVGRMFLEEAALLGVLGVVVGVVGAFVASVAIDAAGVTFRLPGTVGTVVLRIMPGVAHCAAVGAALVVVAGASTFVVAYRRARRGVVALMTA